MRSLSPPAAEVYRTDRDRFVTALFAPPDRREDLFALYAFAVTLARVGETSTEPLAGHIRLQWWRETLAGDGPDARGNPLAEAVRHAVRRHGLARADLLALIDATAAVLDPLPIADTTALLAHAAAVAWPMTRLGLGLLGKDILLASPAAERVIQVTTAGVLGGILRATPRHLARGRILMPIDRLRTAGVVPERLLAGERSPGVATVAAEIAAVAMTVLPPASATAQIPPEIAPLLLHAITTRVLLARLRRRGFNLFAPRAVTPPIVRLWLANRFGRY
ncbi:MAG: phytoene synthase [Rhodospirillaceae bacterium]|nr:MAG: phytoene synthase [Rhodospirillaceae bacterium]